MIIDQYNRIISTSRFVELRDEIMRVRQLINISVRRTKNGDDNEYVIYGPFSDRKNIDKLVEYYNEN
jgi:hypothetical protein